MRPTCSSRRWRAAPCARSRATTWAEYKKYIEKDPALTRRFQVVQVDEPTEDKALLMMRGVASTLEKHHRVQLLDEALEAAVKLSHRYIPARQLPDKAVSLLDTACARVAVSQHADPARGRGFAPAHRGPGDRAGDHRPRGGGRLRRPASRRAEAEAKLAAGDRSGWPASSSAGRRSGELGRPRSSSCARQLRDETDGRGARPTRARRGSTELRELQVEARASCRASRR